LGGRREGKMDQRGGYGKNKQENDEHGMNIWIKGGKNVEEWEELYEDLQEHLKNSREKNTQQELESLQIKKDFIKQKGSVYKGAALSYI